MSEQQWLFVKYLAQGMPSAAAGRHAGYKFPGIQAAQLLAKPHVQAALARERAKYEAASSLSKKKVLDGLLEAVDMAKVQADPMGMVAGYREIAKMCGYYEATKHKLEVSVNGQVVMHKLQALSDEQLLQLAEGTTDAIEGDFALLPEPPDAQS